MVTNMIAYDQYNTLAQSGIVAVYITKQAKGRGKKRKTRIIAAIMYKLCTSLTIFAIVVSLTIQMNM